MQIYNLQAYVSGCEQRLCSHAGIMLTPAQWAAVTAAAAAVAEALEGDVDEFGTELGDMRQLRVREVGNNATVDIREFYDKDGTPAPGKKGTFCDKICILEQPSAGRHCFFVSSPSVAWQGSP